MRPLKERKRKSLCSFESVLNTSGYPIDIVLNIYTFSNEFFLELIKMSHLAGMEIEKEKRVDDCLISVHEFIFFLF